VGPVVKPANAVAATGEIVTLPPQASTLPAAATVPLPVGGVTRT
jgi:hypothetical protein